MPSKAEPVTELRRVKIVESGEPLVDFLQTCPGLRLDRPRFTYRRETVVRQSVAAMLCDADARLREKGLRLAIIEGWRAPLIQRRMYAAVTEQFSRRFPDWSPTKLKRVVNQFSAPMDPRVPPPHTTGGAVDLALTDEAGNPLDLHSPFLLADHASFAFDAPGLSDGARRNRDALAEALLPTGLTNYPSEYWHWSYGDQGWAYRGGHPHALYAAITPEGWEPAPDDVSEAPLVFLGGEAAP